MGKEMEYFRLLRKINTEIIFENNEYLLNIERAKLNWLREKLEKNENKGKEFYSKLFSEKETYSKFNSSLIEMEFFQEIRDIYSTYWNDVYDKTRKNKIIFFLYVSNIYLRNRLENKKNNFFKGKPLFSSFKNGPILWKIDNEEIYKFWGVDNSFDINYEKWSKDIKDFYKKQIKVLRKCTTEELIRKSHDTDCWRNNDWSKEKYVVIPEKEIVEEFRMKPPFIFIGE